MADGSAELIRAHLVETVLHNVRTSPGYYRDAVLPVKVATSNPLLAKLTAAVDPQPSY